MGVSLGIELRITDQMDLVPCDTNDKRLVDGLLGLGNRKNKYVVIAPFMSSRNKDISYNFLRKIINYITKECQTTCVVVGRAKQMNNEELENCIDLIRETNPYQLKCLLINSKYVMVADSGSMYVSCAQCTNAQVDYCKYKICSEKLTFHMFLDKINMITR